MAYVQVPANEIALTLRIAAGSIANKDSSSDKEVRMHAGKNMTVIFLKYYVQFNIKGNISRNNFDDWFVGL